MKVIVGLGNPGVHYQETRHNIGFQVVDRLAAINHISIRNHRFKTIYGRGFIDCQQVVLVKPMTFMNRSGEAVKQVALHLDIGREDLVVIHDDLDLTFGRLRFKRRGGDGGHQGVRSIIESVDGNNFIRLKVGIGRPPRGMDPADYVLSPFDEGERPQLDEVVSCAAESIGILVLEGIDPAMRWIQKKS